MKLREAIEAALLRIADSAARHTLQRGNWSDRDECFVVDLRASQKEIEDAVAAELVSLTAEKERADAAEARATVAERYVLMSEHTVERYIEKLNGAEAELEKWPDDVAAALGSDEQRNGEDVLECARRIRRDRDRNAELCEEARGLVENAYREGWVDCHSSEFGNVDILWLQSGARASLRPQSTSAEEP